MKGCIVTIDALGGHKDIAQTILDQQADYVKTVQLLRQAAHFYPS